MNLPIETCIKCDEATGRAGRADDSLYIDDDGPFCWDCFKEKQADPAQEGDDYDFHREQDE